MALRRLWSRTASRDGSSAPAAAASSDSPADTPIAATKPSLNSRRRPIAARARERGHAERDAEHAAELAHRAVGAGRLADRLPGTDPTTEFWAAGKDIEIPIPATISGAIICA